MDFNITLVGVIILLVIFIPVLYLIFIASGKTKKIKNKIMHHARTHQINPNKLEVVGAVVMGLDETTKKLIYTYLHNPVENFKIVSLQDLKHAAARVRKHSDGDILWAGLELTDQSATHEIAFYRDESDDDASRDPQVCFQDAKKWEHLLRPYLKA